MSDAIKPGFPSSAGANVKPNPPKVRVWPAIFIVALIWAAKVLPERLVPDSMMAAFMGNVWGSMLGVALFAVWWIFLSRVSWKDVGLGLVVVAAGMGAVTLLAHESIGAFVVLLYLGPFLVTAAVLWLAVTPMLSWPIRRNGMFFVMLAVCGGFIGARLDGTNGSFVAAWRPRWQTTEEDRRVAERAAAGAAAPAPKLEAPAALVAGPGDWPEFRGGPKRDSILSGVRIATDWQAHPPKLLWKHRVGPGWSSFAVVGDRIYTQEQLAKDEAVICYDANTGAEIWAHTDSVRFSETVAGPGPRATPTFHEGKIYAQGATGKLNCLDARTGGVIWSRDIVADEKLKVPTWGFAASPLVASGVVTIFGGAPGKAVLAYDAATGEPVWQRGDGEFSYCSTERAKIAGVDQLLLATNEGVLSVEPKSGKELWRHDWLLAGGMSRVTQPNVIADSDVLIGTSFDQGTRRIHVSKVGEDWTTSEVWTTKAIKPYYNDFVVYENHLYGFDGAFFTCVDLNDGKRKWRVREYGNGQALLLADQGALLILGESGEVALVEASPAGHKELARIQGIEEKTWNHPVIANGRLYIRNGKEAACYELTPASQSR